MAQSSPGGIASADPVAAAVGAAAGAVAGFVVDPAAGVEGDFAARSCCAAA
jgi:hypothetical protein